MRTTFFTTCGVSIAALVLGLSLVATPVMAAGERHGGGGGAAAAAAPFMAAAAAPFMAAAAAAAPFITAAAAAGTAATPAGGGWHGAHGGSGGGWHGGYAGGGGGYGNGYGGYGNGYGYGGAALGLGLLGGAIIGSQDPYYDSGYGDGASYDVTRRTEVEIPRPTARGRSDRTIRRAGRTSATTASGILARELTERSPSAR